MILSVKEIHDGRDGDREVITGKGAWKGVGRYTRVFRVWTSSPYDEAQTVLLDPRIPSIGSPYPWNFNSYCQKQNAKNQSQGKRHWIVTCSYSSDYEMSENPLDEPARWVWRTEEIEKEMMVDGHGIPITNTAMEPFMPPNKAPWTHYVGRGQKNVPGMPNWWTDKDYTKSVNKAAVTIDGETYVKWTLRMKSLELGEWQMRNDIWYRVLNMEVVYESVWQNHQLRVPNVGMHCKNRSNPNWLQDCVHPGTSEPVRKPVPLDMNGYQLFVADPSQIPLLTFSIYLEEDWSQLPLV